MNTSRERAIAGVAIVIVLALGAWYLLTQPTRTNLQEANPEASSTPVGQKPGSQATPALSGTVELAIGQTGKIGNVSITPREVVEDSRCPTDVQCIQAGRIRVLVTLSSGLGSGDQIFLLGEPVTTEAEAVTFVSVKPATKVSTVKLRPSDYRFTFRVDSRAISYVNASADMIRVTLPQPGAVVGKEFRISGEARGPWYFEASFPIEVVGKNGQKLATVVAQAQEEWTTSSFVPFIANVTIPSSYIGPATIILHRDNASGLPENDASASFEVTIEY
jgi:hypothetical protein